VNTNFEEREKKKTICIFGRDMCWTHVAETIKKENKENKINKSLKPFLFLFWGYFCTFL